MGLSAAPFSGTLTQAWNDAGVTFTGLELDVTDTASAAASLLFAFKVGGVSKITGSKSGTVYSVGGIFRVDNAATGMFFSGDDFGWRQNSSAAKLFLANEQSLRLKAGLAFGWSGTGDASAPADLKLSRDAANTLAQLNDTNAQSSHLYDTWASATDYHRLATKTARATLSGVTGATVTATGLIPAGAVVVGVTSKVTTGLGETGGTTGYQIGDGVDPDRWGAIVGVAAGTSSDNRDWTATTVQAFNAAQDVVVTAVGGNFDGTGVIYLSVQYLMGQAD